MSFDHILLIEVKLRLHAELRPIVYLISYSKKIIDKVASGNVTALAKAIQ